MDAQARALKLLAKGTHRAVTPTDTLARIRPMMNRFGITRVANVTGLDRIGIPVALAIRPNARALAVSQGKGRTIEAAMASALMESIEIWHAERVNLALHYGTAADLGVPTVDLARLPPVAWKARTPADRHLWAPSKDLMSGRSKYVPFEMIHADYTQPGIPGAGGFPCSTNGLASGNHLLEAISHGICEVIERDALSVWHALSEADQRATGVDPTSIVDDWCQSALARFAGAGLDVRVWDVTSDTEVATLLCLVRDPDPSSPHLGLGSGTHPDRRLALSRALTEAAQVRLNYISGAREDLRETEYEAAGLAEKTDAVEYLFGAQPRQMFDHVPHGVHETLEEDRDWLLARLSTAGIHEVAVTDLTRVDIAIPVVRVVIPGLEAPHDDDSYVPGSRAGGTWCKN
ncbi:MAG: YcaO-like family protein [Paracoccaceae bacterium]